MRKLAQNLCQSDTSVLCDIKMLLELLNKIFKIQYSNKIG